jgi:hypothetical protein
MGIANKLKQRRKHMEKDARSSLLQMAKGAIQERVDYEVSRVVDNILDMNTEAKYKRKVTLTIVMVPDDDRQVVKIEASAKSALAPVTPVGTSLVITADGNGEMMLAEIIPQVPGQISMNGDVQEKPKILKIAATN